MIINSEMHKSISLYNIMMYFCVLLSGLVPRYISNFKFHVVIDISLFTLVVLATWIICDRRIRFYHNIESWFFPIWFIVIIFSVSRAHRIGIWASYLDWILTALFFMQLIYHRPNKETFEIIIRAIVDALFIQLIIGIYEVTTHHYIFEIGYVGRRLYGNVAISMFHNLNDYVTFVVTLMPFSIYRFITQKKALWRLYNVFIIIASIFLVIRSESRSGYLSLILIGCVVLFLFCRKSKMHRAFSAMTLMIIVAVTAIIPELRNSILTLINNLLYDQSGTSDIVRINLIKNGLYFLKQTYGFGVGAGNLHYWLTERSIYPIGQVAYIHNWYIELLATFGVVFFILYLFLHIKVIVRLFNSIGSVGIKNGFWNLNNTFLVSFIAFSLVSIASSSNIYSEWVWMYIVLVPSYVLFCKDSNNNTL